MAPQPVRERGKGGVSAHPDRPPFEGAQTRLLRVFLETAVPMWAAAAAAWPAERIAREAHQAREVLAHGAAALFQPDRTSPGPGPGCPAGPNVLTITTGQAAVGANAAGFRHADIFDAIAKALGLAALLPGGVTWLGRHWCTAPHETCPGMIPAAWMPGHLARADGACGPRLTAG
jgi:hypothetical protein